jgi:sugar phosphate isomerase/epimerase
VPGFGVIYSSLANALFRATRLTRRGGRGNPITHRHPLVPQEFTVIDTPAIDRRNFLSATAALGLGALSSGLVGAAPDKKADDPFGGFKLGAQSYTFRKFKLEQALKRIQGAGLKYVEFAQNHAPRTDKADAIKALLKMCKDYDITPLAWGVQGFSKDKDDARKSFEFAKALGCKMISADPSPDSFDVLDKLVEEFKIAIGIHPHGPQGKKLHRWYSAEVILKAVKDHNKLIGTCLDTGHLIRAAQLGKKLDPAKQIRLMGARNFGIHLKDNDNKADRNVVIGKGAMDVPAVVKALRDVKFKGLISIEYEANEDEPSPDVKACVRVFKDAARKKA